MMANWDYVFVYTQEGADALAALGVAHPTVREGNRLPTTGEVRQAIAECGDLTAEIVGDRLYLSEAGADGWSLCLDHFDWSDEANVPETHFRIRYQSLAQIKLLVLLCRRCGQLLVWPDTGDLPMVLEGTDDAATVFEQYEDASRQFLARE